MTEKGRRKWRWAGHVARKDADKWPLKALRWNPTEGRRCVGRPARRWEEALLDFFKAESEQIELGGASIWQFISYERD